MVGNISEVQCAEKFDAISDAVSLGLRSDPWSNYQPGHIVGLRGSDHDVYDDEVA